MTEIVTIEHVSTDIVEDADYVVVGSGAGGASAAWRLVEAGCDVAMLEEGPPVGLPDFGTQMFPAMAKMYRDNGMEAAVGRSMISMLQGRVVGGTTVVNSAIAWRVPEPAYERWSFDPAVRASFPLEDLHKHWDVLDEMMCVTPTALPIAGRGNTLPAQGAERLGWKGKVMNRFTRGCLGAGRCQQGCPNLAKQSTALNLIPAAMRKGMRVYATALVERVELDATGRAIGVAGRFRDPTLRRDGPRFRIRANKGVVLAPGCIQLPGLLHASGFRHRLLGEHFQAHPGAGLVPFFTDEVKYWEGATQGWETDHFADEGVKFEVVNVPLEINAARFPGVGRELARNVARMSHAGSWGVLVRMEAEGSVRSRPGRSARVKFTPLEDDMRRLRRALHNFAKIAVEAGAVQVMPGIYGLPPLLERDEIDRILDASLDPRHYTMVATHLFGTARAAASEDAGVCDPQFRPWGTRNLWVTDSSPFPRNLGVNPQFMIQATAMQVAEKILGA
ncbi:MAG: GMC family oxidoreductase [Acidimicrobiia bacterium]|nr:GMC family oxidoreductase [Acidimicrobiia bacterium]